MWFDNQAEEAASLYASLFKNSKIGSVSRYGEAGAQVSGLPKGTVMTVMFQIAGQEFMALNGGPMFNFTPAVSFFVNCESQQEITELWNRLSAGGTVLMELAEYPFAEKFGWLQDKFGVSWQLILSNRARKIIPFFMFVGAQHGKAEQAMNSYVSLFQDSSIHNIVRYGAGEEEPQGTVQHAVFSLAGQEFMAMDSNRKHPFTFTPAISFMVNCETQKEIDEYWERLSAGGEKEECGWLKDKYGVSWQIVPTILEKMLTDRDTAKSERVMAAVLQMKKPDIETLEQAYSG